jgi:CheY-like chemotaxis protein
MTSLVSLRALDVLLVEDDAGDALITREAFERSQIPSELHVVNDGEKALNFLRQLSEYKDAPRPALILLDINLPRCSGLEVLGEMKADGDLKTIPVVVLTTSSAHEDILRSYQLHANAYVTKPVGFDLYTETVRQIDEFFLALARLPN